MRWERAGPSAGRGSSAPVVSAVQAQILRLRGGGRGSREPRVAAAVMKSAGGRRFARRSLKGAQQRARRPRGQPPLRGSECGDSGCHRFSPGRSAGSRRHPGSKRASSNLATLSSRGAAGRAPPLACCAVPRPRSPGIYVLSVVLRYCWCVTRCALRTRRLK